ncbi:MAG: PilZ domain-containing protein [Candidatus Omnitrophota bacterium]|nr:MAG: PilZ domain-containing protein [Candidatus Omnitrophota bacterium]
MEWEGVERRKYVRIKFPCKIFIFTPQQHIISTHTENISMGGIKIAIEEELEISSIIELEIYIHEETVVCKGRVIWVTKKESRCHKGVFYYDIGINFYDISAKDKKIIKRLVESKD